MEKRSAYELNEKEKKVLAACPRKPGSYITIEELARRAFKSHGIASKTKGNSWVRNSLRKLLKLKLVEHKGGKSGEYARTERRPSDVLNEAIDKGKCPGPKVGTKPEKEEKPEKEVADDKAA